MNKGKVWALMLSAVALILSGCGQGAGEVKGEGKGNPIIIGTNAAFAPFEYIDKGEVTGFDIDLIGAIMEEAGLSYKVENTGWEGMLNGVKEGSMDVGMAGITINEDREQTYDFTSPYFESKTVIVFNKGTKIENALDLKGLKIGVQNGTTGQFAAEKIIGKNNSSMKKYEDVPVAYMALENGDIDAVVTDNVVGNEYVRNNPDKKVKAIVDDENFEPEYYGIMLKKGSDLQPKLEKALQEVLSNGTYEKLYKKWFKESPNLEVLKEKAAK